MGRTSRRSSEDYSSRKRYRRGSSSPRRSPSADKSKCRDTDACIEKRYVDKKTDRSRSDRVRRSRSRSGSYRKSKSRSASPPHVQTRRMSMQAHQVAAPHVPPAIGAHMQADHLKNEGDFSHFPEISQKTREGLIARGITYLFPV